VSEKKPDHVHVLAAAPDGTGIIERYRDGVPEVAGVRRHPKGKPFLPGEEYVYLEPEGDCYRCETVWGGPNGATSVSGPPKVTTDDYRAGWDRIWTKGSEAAN
jgi:hypothetical protein